MSSTERKYSVLLVATVVAVAVMGSCTAPADRVTQGESLYWEEGKPGGSLSVYHDGEIKGFNTLYSLYSSPSSVAQLVRSLVFAAPLRQHPVSGDWEGQLAESWEYVEDMRGIRVSLKEGLKWSNGTTLDAEDVVASLKEVYLNPEIGSDIWNMMTDNGLTAQVTKESDLTFTVLLDRRDYRLMDFVGLYPFPDELIESTPLEEIGLLWTGDGDLDTLVASGPFTALSYDEGESVELRSNPNYCLSDEWGQPLPYIERLVIFLRLFGDRIADFNLKDNSLTRGTYADLEPIYSASSSSVFTYDFDLRDGATFLVFNMNPKEGEEDTGIEPPVLRWLQERKFRQAIAALLDQERINVEYYRGTGMLNYTYTRPGSQHLRESIESAYIRYDPARSARLLDELEYIDRDGDGYREDPDGNVIELEVTTNEDNKERVGTAEILAEEAAKAGIRVTVFPDEFRNVIRRLTATHDFEMLILGIDGTGNSMWNFDGFVQSSGYKHLSYPSQDEPSYEWEKQLDRLWEDASRTPDVAVHRRNFEEIQKILLQECPWVFSVKERLLYVSSVELGNVRIDGTKSEYVPFIERMFFK